MRHHLIDLPLRLLDDARVAWLKRRAGRHALPPEAFFRRTGLPGEDRYEEALERVNADLPGYLDPGPVEAPPARRVEREGDWIRFPSPRPTGHAAADRAGLRLLSAPRGADVGVLFHHWIYLESWRPVEYLLAPLLGRYRVACMLAPSHGDRSQGLPSGVGMLNPNPLLIFEGLRQWQADHAASVALLRRDHGFERTVVLGYSMGGYFALLARLFGESLPLVATCVTNDFALGIYEGVATPQLVARLREVGFTRESFARATRSLKLARWAERAGGEGVSWISARDDRIEPLESLRSVPPVLRPDRTVELPGGHSTAVLFRRRIAREIDALAGSG